ncbi:7,8-didemethyl-8-hydroxy-5-deazariboflavin synthase CofG [Mycetocola reblochoni]|uniref:7,8-didemethyl-8-hydroxy-5-deazariboflavin synthase n=2 Tax=Mycetocola reblochoni TaxID=331618 RepID=A0A1R4IVN0_9MICO|nr:7,8-didemethyl-8-hydroxy-5-deazariboflavin synthase CofG [Mycetocola reblochoni]RLP71034.1 7,8-didemethyl-8-hydroxy-5-deazariboflavin synthase subunit CofG [Mycetocola reblochoni]SJN23383.1 7,8-didemethyl-8-hydroxy-5-deazariboflavin synthase subunit 1 / 7,8-didemethyl-8-hydroxy-5-deazariboflavin synthase subunit 2 [Mycetocola reblochoni REB411]
MPALPRTADPRSAECRSAECRAADPEAVSAPARPASPAPASAHDERLASLTAPERLDACRNALGRIEDGIADGIVPSRADALALLHARGGELARLLAAASAIRDAGLARRGRPGVITYSRKVFIPVTTLCRDRCHYCVFVDTPGGLRRQGISPYLSGDEVVAIAAAGAELGCREALFTLGDRPEDRWPVARQWLAEHGFGSTVDYLRHLGERVLAETGLLPHMNPGVMTWREMQLLRPVSPSMGMMLETTSTRIWTEPGGAHLGSPDKDPALRLRVIEEAGQSAIPFSTGVLLGIGEDDGDRVDALFALREAHERHGHVQEVIVQNFRVKPRTAMQNAADLGLHEYLAAVAVARLVLGGDMSIQVPPNLSDDADLSLLISAGIDDWGGVSPLTPDHVNPERPWPQIDSLAARTAAAGFTLRERLTAHPGYVRDAENWIDASLRPLVRSAAGADGLARVGGGSRAAGHAIAEPAGDSATARGHTVGGPTAGGRVDPDIRRALDRVAAGRAPGDADAAALLGARGEQLAELCALADAARRRRLGDALGVVVNRNLDGTRIRLSPNTALTARAAPGDHPAATDRATAADGSGPLGADDLGRIAADAWELGATELCLQGRVDGGARDGAIRAVDALHAAAPLLHLHACRPAEIRADAEQAGRPLTTQLELLRTHGVRSIPGTGALILDDAIRKRVDPHGPSAAEWIATIEAAHRAGLTSTSTLVHGLGESPAQTVAHLRALRGIQDRTGGITELIVLPWLTPSATDPHGRGPGLPAALALTAVARLLVGDAIPHLQAPWPRVGLEAAAALLRAGADDLGGVLRDGRVHPSAGAEQGKELGVAELERLAATLGRPLRHRLTGYADAPAERVAAFLDAPGPSGPSIRDARLLAVSAR